MADKKLEDLFEEGQDLDAAFEAGEDVSAAMPQADSGGMLEDVSDFGRGVTSGATMGFADEIYGGAAAIPELIKGGDAYLKKYREEQKASEAAFEAARERSPVANFAGELAGGIGTGFLTAGLGAGGAAANLAKTGGTQALKLLSKEGAKLAGKKALEVGAKTAALGAIEGAGRSKGTLGSGEMGQDILAGGTYGGLIGGGLSGLGSVKDAALGTAKEFVDESAPAFLRQTKKAFDLGQEGTFLGSEADQIKDLSRRAPKAASELVDKIKSADAELGMAVGQSINDATKRGVMIPVGEEVQQSAEDLVRYYGINPNLDLSGKVRRVLASLGDRSKASMNPEELRSYKAFLEESLDSFKGSTSPEVNQVRGNLVKLLGGVDNKLKDAIPEYRKAAGQFAEFRQRFVEPLERMGMPEGSKADVAGSISKRSPGIFKGAETMYDTATVPGAQGERGQRILGELQEGVESLQQSKNPAAKILGTADQFVKDTKDKADVAAIYQQSRGISESNAPGRSLLGSAIGMGKNALFYGANAAGKVSKAGNKAFNIDASMAQSVGERLKQTPGMEFLGDALLKGAENKNTARINSIMFTLLQKPQGRELLRDMGLEEESEE